MISVRFGMYKENENEPRLNKKYVLKADFRGIREELSKIDWEHILNELNIDEAYDRFLSIYYKIWIEFVPIKRSTNGKKCRGRLSEETRGLIK